MYYLFHHVWRKTQKKWFHSFLCMCSWVPLKKWRANIWPIVVTSHHFPVFQNKKDYETGIMSFLPMLYYVCNQCIVCIGVQFQGPCFQAIPFINSFFRNHLRFPQKVDFLVNSIILKFFILNHIPSFKSN